MKISGNTGEAYEFDLSAVQSGFTLAELVTAQSRFRAALLQGHEAADDLARGDTVAIVLHKRGADRMVGYARRAFATRAGALGDAELALVDGGNASQLAVIMAEQGWTAETPVTYALIDPRRHEVVTPDMSGTPRPRLRNPGFVLRLDA